MAYKIQKYRFTKYAIHNLNSISCGGRRILKMTGIRDISRDTEIECEYRSPVSLI